MLRASEIDLIRSGTHGDPFAVLGAHVDGRGAQEREWNHDQRLDWHLLDDPSPANLHAGVRKLYTELNRLYRATSALHERDFGPEGFEWIDHSDADRWVISFARRGASEASLIVIVCDFTPTVHAGFRLGVPRAGTYPECLNTDSAHYGGSNVGTPLGAAAAQAVACNVRENSVVIDLPPLATVMFEWTS